MRFASRLRLRGVPPFSRSAPDSRRAHAWDLAPRGALRARPGARRLRAGAGSLALRRSFLPSSWPSASTRQGPGSSSALGRRRSTPNIPVSPSSRVSSFGSGQNKTFTSSSCSHCSSWPSSRSSTSSLLCASTVRPLRNSLRRCTRRVPNGGAVLAFPYPRVRTTTSPWYGKPWTR